MKLGMGKEQDKNVQHKTEYPMKLGIGKEQDTNVQTKLDNPLTRSTKQIATN